MDARGREGLELWLSRSFECVCSKALQAARMHFRSSFSSAKAEPDDGSCKLNRAADLATKLNLCASLHFWDGNFSSQLLSTALNAAQSSKASPSKYCCGRPVGAGHSDAESSIPIRLRSLWLSSHSSGPNASLQICVFRLVIGLQVQSSGTARGLLIPRRRSDKLH